MGLILIDSRLMWSNWSRSWKSLCFCLLGDLCVCVLGYNAKKVTFLKTFLKSKKLQVWGRHIAHWRLPVHMRLQCHIYGIISSKDFKCWQGPVPVFPLHVVNGSVVPPLGAGSGICTGLPAQQARPGMVTCPAALTDLQKLSNLGKWIWWWRRTQTREGPLLDVHLPNTQRTIVGARFPEDGPTEKAH